MLTESTKILSIFGEKKEEGRVIDETLYVAEDVAAEAILKNKDKIIKGSVINIKVSKKASCIVDVVVVIRRIVFSLYWFLGANELAEDTKT